MLGQERRGEDNIGEGRSRQGEDKGGEERRVKVRTREARGEAKTR